MMQAMMDSGISTRRGIMCAHREAAYADALRRHGLDVSVQAQDHSIILPLYPRMTDADIERVIDGLAQALREG